MNQEQRQAYEWAKKQNYPSVAARYSKILAGLVDEITQPNEPLTLEELRAIVEPTPIWWTWLQGWVLAKNGMILSWDEGYRNCGGVRGDFYRRPQEGEEET